ncbi:MAG: hypothetical protein EXR69_00955 [Myxococcales bacterium]|nr:hypothetical protein [Myxococcales bacterium]
MLTLIALSALVCGQAYAWEQMFISGEVTVTLGAQHPFGGAISVQFGEAPVAYDGPDLRLGLEASAGPGGPALTGFGRAGLQMNGWFSNYNWHYSPGLGTYTELGYTWRPLSWSGPRVGGGVNVYPIHLRYHQLIRTWRVDPARVVWARLPLPVRHPSALPDLDLRLALACEVWMFPRPFRR